MKTLVRAGMLVTLLLAGAPLAAQDASTAPAAEPAAPAPPMTDDDALRALADGPAAAPVDVQTAPADPPPSDAPDPGPVEAAAAVANPEEATTEASAVESAPLPPPSEIAPAVGVSAATSFTAAEEAPRRRHGSDWIFVGIVALAAVGILRKFAREPIENVSIHGASEASANPPIAEAPPILRKR